MSALSKETLDRLRADPDIDDARGQRAVSTATRVLAFGPWCGPRDAAGTSHGSVPPGRNVVVSVTPHGERASLWCIAWEAPDDAVALTRASADSWHTAGAALHRSASLLWRSLSRALERGVPRAVTLRGVTLVENQTPPVETHLDGESYGVAFALLLASDAFDLAVPGDIVATGALYDGGGVRSVGGVYEKTLAVALGAPTVTRFLVPTENVADALRAVRDLGARGEHLNVVGIATLTAALDTVWGDGVEQKLITLGDNPADREAIVDGLFWICVERGWAEVKDFAPVLRATELIEKAWRDLDENQRQRLAVAGAVARRHVENRGVLDVPTEAQLMDVAAPLRLRWAAQVVQQAADTGGVEPEAVRALVERHLVRGSEAFLPHCQLLGAAARFEAMRGDPVVALGMSEEAANAFLHRHAFADVSHALCEWFRLAGALADADALPRAEALSRADEFDAHMAVLNGASSTTSSWVALARGIAHARVGGWDVASPLLERVASDATAAPHVVAAAHRWLVRRDFDRGLSTSSWLDAVTERADAERVAATGRANFGIVEAMVVLDGAVVGSRSVSDALAFLRAQDPAICDALDDGSDFAERLRRFYPYA